MFTGYNGYKMTSYDLDKFNRTMKQIFKVQGILFRESKKKQSVLEQEKLIEYRTTMKKLLERTKPTYLRAETTMDEKVAFEREVRKMAMLVYSICGNK